MDAGDIIKAVVTDCDVSQVQISKRIGRSNLFIGSYITRKIKPNIELMAEICDVTDHDLIVRNRKTGREITIDPPERENDED